MKIRFITYILLAGGLCISFMGSRSTAYADHFHRSVKTIRQAQESLLEIISSSNLRNENDIDKLRKKIHANRLQLKVADFWLRYFDPVAYRKLNGPLPVEWETEMFERLEPPYKRTGAGLTLAELYLDEEEISTSHLQYLIKESLDSMVIFESDSVAALLQEPDHFFLANRLYLLNLSSIYTTGFECPDTSLIIPELKFMAHAVINIYTSFNQSWPERKLPKDYMSQYEKMLQFLETQPPSFSTFNHFLFIRDHVNPLFKIAQRLVRDNKTHSANYNDYALHNEADNLFDKNLFLSQNNKGVFSFVEDSAVLEEIKELGRLLFYDPVLSGNNKRSCASCHHPTQFFTDTTRKTALQFDGISELDRNTPSLINSVYNHLAMYDGKHISLQAQAVDVITNPNEMGGNEQDILKKLHSIKTYRDGFKKLLQYTPEEKKISLNHVVGAITFYYSQFSNFYSPFDEAMMHQRQIDNEVVNGFNIFMSKAVCATCHFVPHFNGTRPPFIGTEFEILGTPADSLFKQLSNDKGRFLVNPADETLHAFRTGSVRNSSKTAPYMHNGVFQSMQQLIDFYDGGGGAGHGLFVPNQTLAADSLKLSDKEKSDLISFLSSLTEKVIFEDAPEVLPSSSNKSLNGRKVGGEY